MNTLAAPPANTWSDAIHASADDLAAVQEQPVWTVLSEFGVIQATGPDATTFLQGQLTNNSAAALKQTVRNGYCTPKGRLLAVFDHWAEGDTHYLQLPREILAPVLKRLSMYVLRAKVKLSDASETWNRYALLGPGAAQALQQAQLPLPEVGMTATQGALRIWHQSAGTQCQERYLLTLPSGSEQEETWLASLHGSARTVGSGVWWWSQVDAGVPTVLAATQEKFVPQMINLEVLGGVDFRKGCYPGQEIVARSQYLGKLRRRMHLAHTQGTSVAGADVFAAGQEAIGTVVLAAAAPHGGMDVLFEAAVDAVQGALKVGSSDGPALVLRPLPYVITDVTA